MMLSDEEKKAIDLLEQYLNFGNKEGVLCRNLRTIYTIIEKKSKEIEELNKENTRQHELIGNIHQKWKDKIKSKIEDILNSENGEAIEKLIEWQSLLEKE